jgi:hypothetical protein
MNDKIVTVTFEKCGGCRFAQKSTNNVHDCFGHPPSVHIIGMAQPDALGRAGMQLEMFVPKVRGDRPACALYQPQADFSTIGRS